MKHTILALLCMAVVTMFTACIGGNANKKTADGKAKAKTEEKAEKSNKMTVENWKEIIKENYDFDFILPQNWKLKSGMKTNINPAYWLKFINETDESGGDYRAFVKAIFDMTANIIPGTGNFSDDRKPITEPNYDIWRFNTPKGSVQLTISKNKSDNSVSVNLCYIGEAIKK